uniref:Uncharacterized protein n=1 Tax=Geobacter sp. (strain M21) TaxID=443144 RepID=C6E6Q0_GEOSM
MASDGFLKWEDGEVRLGGELLPGVFVDQSIRGAVRFDESKKDSQSGHHKTPLGFEDADIVITLDLLTDDTSDCYKKLAAINKVFREDRKANPKVYAVQNRHCAARGIRDVVFCALDSFESSDDDVISAALSFKEHLPPVIRREKQATATKVAGAKQGAAPKIKATPAASPTVVSDSDNPFMAGFNAGAN